MVAARSLSLLSRADALRKGFSIGAVVAEPPVVAVAVIG